MASPITSVTPVNFAGTETGAAVTTLVSPATFQPSIIDVCSPDQAQTEALKFNKMRLGTRREIAVSWVGLSLSECAAVLSAFSSEYVKVAFLDPYSGSSSTKNFHVSTRTAPLLAGGSDRWENVSFTLTQQTTD